MTKYETLQYAYVTRIVDSSEKTKKVNGSSKFVSPIITYISNQFRLAQACLYAIQLKLSGFNIPHVTTCFIKSKVTRVPVVGKQQTVRCIFRCKCQVVSPPRKTFEGNVSLSLHGRQQNRLYVTFPLCLHNFSFKNVTILLFASRVICLLLNVVSTIMLVVIQLFFDCLGTIPTLNNYGDDDFLKNTYNIQ